ncbi:hypothetical protein K435DRAFT_855620 [Dendrothele bispora CBS 962.96]|uniref:Uncharacterized protein n=1 Tax=Dendrothele bispora (strain CBS 962.96) TaxID=1314807 RepID=A0A4S8MAP3_DENBC|nr:hypothetical protein K435DRAFT_855620 [Dendrothele bispora CBS 962.96]
MVGRMDQRAARGFLVFVPAATLNLEGFVDHIRSLVYDLDNIGIVLDLFNFKLNIIIIAYYDFSLAFLILIPARFIVRKDIGLFHLWLRHIVHSISWFPATAPFELKGTPPVVIASSSIGFAPDVS